VDAPEVAINRQPAIVIMPPLKGNGWLATAACCKPNVHKDERVAIDGVRIETGETSRGRLGQGQERQTLRRRWQEGIGASSSLIVGSFRLALLNTRFLT
jgi:hypothetical protein